MQSLPLHSFTLVDEKGAEFEISGTLHLTPIELKLCIQLTGRRSAIMETTSTEPPDLAESTGSSDGESQEAVRDSVLRTAVAPLPIEEHRNNAFVPMDYSQAPIYVLPRKHCFSPTEHSQTASSVPARGNARRRIHIGFLDLPPELRIDIYGYLLPEPFKDQWDPWRTCDTTLSSGQGELCVFRAPLPRPFPRAHGYNALLCTCKSIYIEASDVLYNSTTVHGRARIPNTLVISDGSICLRGRQFHCVQHDAFDHSLPSILQRFRTIRVLITDGFSEGSGLLSRNINWCLNHLSSGNRISQLEVVLGYGLHALEDEGHAALLRFAVAAFKPFYRLRGLEKVAFKYLQCWSGRHDEWSTMRFCSGSGCAACAKMQDLVQGRTIQVLQSNDPIERSSQISELWSQLDRIESNANSAFFDAFKTPIPSEAEPGDCSDIAEFKAALASKQQALKILSEDSFAMTMASLRQDCVALLETASLEQNSR